MKQTIEELTKSVGKAAARKAVDTRENNSGPISEDTKKDMHYAAGVTARWVMDELSKEWIQELEIRLSRSILALTLNAILLVIIGLYCWNYIDPLAFKAFAIVLVPAFLASLYTL